MTKKTAIRKDTKQTKRISSGKDKTFIRNGANRAKRTNQVKELKPIDKELRKWLTVTTSNDNWSLK